MKKLALVSGVILLAVALDIGLSLWEPHSAMVRAQIFSLVTGAIAVLLITYGVRGRT